MIASLVSWMYQNVWGNLVASATANVIAWFWKLRPHFRKIHEIHTHLTGDGQVAGKSGQVSIGKDGP